MTPTPRAIALIDQLEGASADARAQLADVTARFGGTAVLPAPDSPTRAILHRLADVVAVEGLRLCGHLDASAPRPAWWAPWAPKYLRCAACQLAAGEHFWSSAAARQCDACRHDGNGPLYALLTATAPLLVTPHGGEPVWSLFPVLINYSLCEECVTADERNEVTS